MSRYSKLVTEDYGTMGPFTTKDEYLGIPVQMNVDTKDDRYAPCDPTFAIARQQPSRQVPRYLSVFRIRIRFLRIRFLDFSPIRIRIQAKKIQRQKKLGENFCFQPKKQVFYFCFQPIKQVGILLNRELPFYLVSFLKISENY